MRRILLLILASLTVAQAVQAQIQVDLAIKRRLFVMYEPIVAEVTITNRTGRDIPLADTNGQQWFGFVVMNTDGQPVAPYNPNYKLDPLTVPAGASVKRTVDIGAIYPVHDLGIYRVRAAIYFAPMDKYFPSPQTSIEITEAKTLWQQTVGVPDGEKNAGSTRRLSLLSFESNNATTLYVRVEDPDNGVILGTVPLGPMIDRQPQKILDAFNHLHVLQVSGGKTYIYSRIGLNGEKIQQQTFVSAQRQPVLRRDKVGEVTVFGGQYTGGAPPEPGTAVAATPAPVTSKLSDRPSGLPAN